MLDDLIAIKTRLKAHLKSIEKEIEAADAAAPDDDDEEDKLWNTLLEISSGLEVSIDGLNEAIRYTKAKQRLVSAKAASERS